MTKQAPALTRHDLEAKIVKRCWEDEAFRQEFTADPAGAFVKYLQVPAAGLPKIVVHHETAGSWHIVLPSRPANINELSEQDLESVAGGALTDFVTRTSIKVVTAAAAGGLAISAAVSLSAGEKVDLGLGW
jgi:hypothetical protein